MVDFTTDFRPGVFVRRPESFSAKLPDGGPDNSRNSQFVGRNLGSGLVGPGLDLGFGRARNRPPAQVSVDLSNGARQALYGSERALELAKDFNAARLGRSAGRRLGRFFEGFSRDFGDPAEKIEKTARRVEKLTQDLERRFGRHFETVLSRLESGRNGGFRSVEASYSQIDISLVVESTLLSVVKDGEESLLRLDKVQLSLQAVQVEAGITVRDGIGFAPKTPLFELPKGLTASQIADRLIATFGTSSVSAALETSEIQLDLSRTVFAQRIEGEAEAGGDTPVEAGEKEGAVDVVA